MLQYCMIWRKKEIFEKQNYLLNMAQISILLMKNINQHH